MNRPYVGLKDGKRFVFKSEVTPTDETHGHLYNAVIGPFRTMRAAKFLQKNAWCPNVSHAEKASKNILLKTPYQGEQ